MTTTTELFDRCVKIVVTHLVNPVENEAHDDKTHTEAGDYDIIVVYFYKYLNILAQKEG